MLATAEVGQRFNTNSITTVWPLNCANKNMVYQVFRHLHKSLYDFLGFSDIIDVITKPKGDKF